jgi:hypothetical protein
MDCHVGTDVAVGMNKATLLVARSTGYLQAPVLATQSEPLLFMGGRTNDTHVVTLERFAPYSGSTKPASLIRGGWSCGAITC